MLIRQYQEGDIVFGSWKLVKLLGQGSYGKVYEAHREDFGVIYKAAIKIISVPSNTSEIQNARAEGLDDASITAYFRSIVEDIVSEFGLMSRLKGTANIVSYEDHAVIPHSDSIGWDILIRMELLTPMLDYMSQHKMTRQDIIQLGMDICKALELCQKYNIIHRDIKPENMFVSELGGYKLGDFGVARTLEKTTGGLSKKGTYTYMAPEIYKEEPYGSTVDIYSLGIVMYRLLNNNRAPFLPQPPAGISYSDREKSLVRRISGEPLPVPANAEGRLAEIVLKACSYDPKDRYSSPQQMWQELKAIAYHKTEDSIINRGQEPIAVSKTDFHTNSFSATGEKKSDNKPVLMNKKTEPVSKQAQDVQKPPKPSKPPKPPRSPKPSKDTGPKSQKASRKKAATITLWVVGILIVFLLILLWRFLGNAPAFLPQEVENTIPPILTQATSEAEAPPSLHPTTQTVPASETQLEAPLWEKNVLKENLIESRGVYRYFNDIPAGQIIAVTFLDTLAGAPSSNWDVSEAGDGSVLAWVSGFQNRYELFIAGEGGVNGAICCSWLFGNLENLTQINFNGCFHTEQTTDMNSMFMGCKSLTSLDLSTLDTGNVTDMSAMFHFCSNIQELDLSSFDTGNVSNMSTMFGFCRSLQNLDLSGWDTSQVTDMQWMFYHCIQLQEVDLSSFDTQNVKDMNRMFEGCTNLKHVDLSSFNTASVMDMEQMFFECPCLEDMELSHFDTANVTKYNNFMNASKKVNGKSWNFLFQKHSPENEKTDEEGYVVVDNSGVPDGQLCVLGYRTSDGREIINPKCTASNWGTQLAFSWAEKSDVTTTLITGWQGYDYNESSAMAKINLMLSVWKEEGLTMSAVTESTFGGSFSEVPNKTCYVLLTSMNKDMELECYMILKLGYLE